MSAHTPGPWKRLAYNVVKEEALGTRMVASAEDRDDAILIAAAPEMLTALALARATLRSQLSGHFATALDPHRRKEMEALYESVDDAIAKATGTKNLNSEEA